MKKWAPKLAAWLLLLGTIIAATFAIGRWTGRIEERLTSLEGKVDRLLGTREVVQWVVAEKGDSEECP